MTKRKSAIRAVSVATAKGMLTRGHAKPSKYRNARCEWKGEKFDSKRELERHLVLLDMQKRGEISDLLRQYPFTIKVEGMKICTYVADWRYVQRGQNVIEDAKGFRTPEFKLKWKLMHALYPQFDFRLS